jgi:hypothetical protein
MKKRKISKSLSLYLCWRIWDKRIWDKVSTEYYGKRKDEIGKAYAQKFRLARFLFDCPACAYVESEFSDDSFNCEKRCPMSSVWGGGMCEDVVSPYGAWRKTRSRSYDEGFFALFIAEGARELFRWNL